MALTDIFIRRPVLAIVISLLIFVLGLRAFEQLNVRQYPETKNTVITISTAYVGASADLVKGFITTLLEREIATAEGIDYLESNSLQGISVIKAHLLLDYDPNAALTQITSKVNKVRKDLPEQSEEPVFDVSQGQTTAAMYMGFYSSDLQPNQITDYLIRVVQPQLETVEGVQKAEILGGRTFAMRIWLQPERMASLDVTPLMVRDVLRSNNFLAAIGSTKGDMISVSLTASTNLHTAEEFQQLVIREEAGTIIRLGDVARISLGAENYDSNVIFDDQNATFIGIHATPNANVLDVIRDVRKVIPEIRSQFPEGLTGEVVYDTTLYIEEAIDEVVRTLIEALFIVIVVIFLFLGTFRSVIIPAVTIPLSLVGAGLVMLIFGFTINLLTLLAMVLAIGLVVDDAIIVVENIHRHVENGLAPMKAALLGARELGGPVVAMTITLLAVYTPIGFMGGLTGRLFTEFAFTLSGAVLISGVIALTLSPMMCSRLLKPDSGKQGFAHFLDVTFERLRMAYERWLHGALEYRSIGLLVAVIILGSSYFLYLGTKKELAPVEDQGVVFVQSIAPPNASIDQLKRYAPPLIDIYNGYSEKQNYFQLIGVGPGGSASLANVAFSGMILKPWSQRERSALDIQQELQAKVNSVAGLQSVAFGPPPLPLAASGLPVQFVIGSIDSPYLLNEVSQTFLARVRESGMFVYADTDLKYDKPQVAIHIDRDKAAALGIDMRGVGDALGLMLGGNYVNRFDIEGRSYKVIPQAQRQYRLNPSDLDAYYISTGSGELVPLSTLATTKMTVEPQQLNRFQQLNSAIISAVPAPGVSMGDALGFMEQLAQEIFPRGYAIDYAGESRQYIQEGSAFVWTFFFAILIIFLVLAAQFESFRDPCIMLITVPLSISGALIFLNIGFATINIYTQVGLITLIGLISKHGILIVQFANQLQEEEGLDKREAVEKAAGIRLRPILMTTAAMVVGVFPLLLASGAGAASRFDIGLVITTGMTFGTLFTLFVVPTIYLYLAESKTRSVDKLAQARSAE